MGVQAPLVSGVAASALRRPHRTGFNCIEWEFESKLSDENVTLLTVVRYQIHVDKLFIKLKLRKHSFRPCYFCQIWFIFSIVLLATKKLLVFQLFISSKFNNCFL